MGFLSKLSKLFGGTQPIRMLPPQTEDSDAIEESRNYGAIAVGFILPLTMVGLDGASWFMRDQKGFAGYILGYADVIAQSTGKLPGSNLGGNIAIRFVEILFADKYKAMIPAVVQYMFDEDPAELKKGLKRGASDANDFLTGTTTPHQLYALLEQGR